MKKAKAPAVPEPVKYDGRICFGIAYFATEQDAEAYAAEVKRKGRTYNGGYFHGMACGRDKGFDHVDKELGKLYAVTN